MAANGIGTADVPDLFTVMADPCPVCGKDRVLVGYRHLCAVPKADAWNSLYEVRQANEIEALQAEVRKLKAELAKANSELEALRVTPVTPSVTPDVTPRNAETVTRNAERQRRWREKRKAQKS